MLAIEWQRPGEGAGSGWRGRSPALAELLRVHVTAAADPLQLVQELAGALPTDRCYIPAVCCFAG